MQDENPYQAFGTHGSKTASTLKRRSKSRWAMIGFVAGATLPVGFGAYWMYQRATDIASTAPGESNCGMGGMRVLGSLVLIFVFGPICGMIGAACSAWIAAAMDWWEA